MTDYVESGIKLIADASDYTSTLEDALSLAESFDELSPEVTVSADTSALNDLEDSFSDLGGDITPEVAPEVTEEGKSLLTTLHELGVNPIEVVMNIAGTILDVLSAINDFAVAPLLDIDTAVAHINAQTGNAIPNARELMNTLYAKDLGDVDAIAGALTHAQQLKLPLEEATTKALEFVKVFPDNNPNDVLDALDQMVKNHLAPDITSAADLLTTAAQTTINKGNDLISVFERSSGAIKDLGLTGDEFLALAKADIEGGGQSAQTFLDTLTKIKAGLQSGSQNSIDALKVLGIPDPATTGEGYTADFFQSVADAIANYKGTDAEKQALFQALVGGKLGQKEYEGFLNIDAAKPSLDALAGATADAATKMDDSLTGAIDDFVLAARVAAMHFLSSDQIDLPGKIAALKLGLQDALNVLSNGGTLGDALTVGLKPLGFDDEFQKLEDILGNFVIELLGLIASLQETFGGAGGADAAKATRATRAGLAKDQLAFELTIDNPDEIAQDFTTAIQRGVDPSAISGVLGDAVDTLITQGATDRAQALLDSIATNASGMKIQLDPSVDAGSRGSISEWLTNNGLGTLNPDGSIDLAFTPGMTPESRQKMIDDVKNGLTYDKYTIVPTITDETKADLQKQITDTVEAAKPVVPTIGTDTATLGGHTLSLGGGSASTDLSSNLEILKEKITGATQPTTDQAEATADLTTKTQAQTVAVGETATNVNDLNYKMGQAQLAASLFGDGVQDVDEYMGEASLTTGETGLALQGAALQMTILSDSTHDFTVNAAAAVSAMQGAAQAAKSAGSAGTAGSGATAEANASGGTFKGLSWVGENGPELIGSGKELSVLNNRTSRALMQALSGMPFMQMGGGGMNKNINLTVNNNVQSPSQAMNISYDIGQQVRGF